MSDCLATMRKMHKDEAARLGISEQELSRRKFRLKILWEEGGGLEGARARLNWAEDYLKRQRANEKDPTE